MPEYIKREDAMSHPFANGKYDHKNASIDFILGHESYKEWLETLPAADVRETVRGRWITYNELVSDMLVCSECERYFIGSGDEYDYNFCPNCGADMRGNDNV